MGRGAGSPACRRPMVAASELPTQMGTRTVRSSFTSTTAGPMGVPATPSTCRAWKPTGEVSLARAVEASARWRAPMKAKRARGVGESSTVPPGRLLSSG